MLQSNKLCAMFKCQEDSYLKEYVTRVISSEPASLDWTPAIGDTEPQTLRGYNVIFENTILFPEGGGQPCDYGSINGNSVRKVVRQGAEAVHFVETKQSFEVGAEVQQRLDWERRLDHMQQHTGQHLITALFDREFSYETTSWWLGSKDCYIELNTAHLITRESLDLIERKANELIRENRTVTARLIDPELALQSPDIRTPRALPKDHTGDVRVICIEGIESNMCCGTHVSNLSQLQCVKLLYAEKSKGSVLVHFVIGERVLLKLGECIEREQQLNALLQGGPAQHLELVQKLQDNCKSTRKGFQKLLTDLAALEAARVEKLVPRPQYVALHRKDGIEPSFINTFLRNAPEDVFYFLTVSESNANDAKGFMVLRGNSDLIQKMAPQFLDVLDGKGSGKDNHFQAKFNDAYKISACDTLLMSHFHSLKDAIANKQ